jgi:GR25 family glycosyltransferase involved in LPS biosynthesis
MLDRVFVIHLPHAERRVAMDAELSRMGLQAEYVHASPPSRDFTMSNMRRNARDEFGIASSHIKAIARADGDALILEDDVRFLCDRKRLDEVVGELPTSWDVCYFGGHPRGPTQRATKSLVKVSTFSFAEAYLISHKAQAAFLDFWLDRAGKPDAMIDLVLGEFAARNNGYCAYPLLTEQAAVVSHVSGKVDAKSHLLVKGWANHLC